MNMNTWSDADRKRMFLENQWGGFTVGRWPFVLFRRDRDLNLTDMLHLADRLYQGEEDMWALPNYRVPITFGTVEIMERFIGGRQEIRKRSREATGQACRETGLAAAQFAQAAYLWLGCIGMAKCTRATYMSPAGEKPYTLAQRRKGYARLLRIARRCAARRNPWVFWGMTLAQGLSLSRGDKIINDWVPAESLYWYAYKGAF